MKKGFDSQSLDLRRFATESAALEEARPLRSFARLFVETEARGGDNPVSWRVRGERRIQPGAAPQVWLHLDASVRLPLTCQRCLSEVDVDVQLHRAFRFVADEATAAAEDEVAEEDVLTESAAFNLVGLVEDELLMAMPLVPRHAVCPQVPDMRAGGDEFDEAMASKENPFAVLGRLKSRG